MLALAQTELLCSLAIQIWLKRLWLPFFLVWLVDGFHLAWNLAKLRRLGGEFSVVESAGDPEILSGRHSPQDATSAASSSFTKLAPTASAATVPGGGGGNGHGAGSGNISNGVNQGPGKQKGKRAHQS